MFLNPLSREISDGAVEVSASIAHHDREAAESFERIFDELGCLVRSTDIGGEAVHFAKKRPLFDNGGGVFSGGGAEAPPRTPPGKAAGGKPTKPPPCPPD